MKKVLIACEFSGVVREAFNAYSGIHAISCDLSKRREASAATGTAALMRGRSMKILIITEQAEYTEIKKALLVPDEFDLETDKMDFFLVMQSEGKIRIRKDNYVFSNDQWKANFAYIESVSSRFTEVPYQEFAI